MNWDRIEGDWKMFKGKVKQKWGQLTDDDLTKINGKREQLQGFLESAMGTQKIKRRQKSRSGRTIKSNRIVCLTLTRKAQNLGLFYTRRVRTDTFGSPSQRLFEQVVVERTASTQHPR